MIMKKILKKIESLYQKVLNVRARLLREKACQQYRGKYKGEKCFVIGNGPSLSVNDLEQVKQFATFGTHRIYHIFDQTDWRPTFYCAQDQKLILQAQDEINQLETKQKFIATTSETIGKIKKAIELPILFCDIYPELPLFSEDITEGIYEGMTVTYMCIQIAAYMGFSDIYLLGVDHRYSLDKSPDGAIIKNDNIKDHFSDKDIITNIPQTYKSTLAYLKAKEYCESHGIKIYNVSRESALDIYEKISLEDALR